MNTKSKSANKKNRNKVNINMKNTNEKNITKECTNKNTKMEKAGKGEKLKYQEEEDDLVKKSQVFLSNFSIGRVWQVMPLQNLPIQGLTQIYISH